MSCLLCAVTQLVTGCPTNSTAVYSMTFTGKWTQEDFPKVYPKLRPKAEWSSVVGRTHTDRYRLFSLEQFASPTLRLMVEQGDSSALTGEGQGNDLILDQFSASPLQQGYGQTSGQFFADSTHSWLSLVAKLEPSPDWFVGVDSLNLCENGSWKRYQELELWPLDAGTQRGYTFSSPRWQSDPIEKVFRITNTYPNHTADAFYYPHIDQLPPIANVSISLLRVLHGRGPLEHPPENNHIEKMIASNRVLVDEKVPRPPIPVFVQTPKGMVMRPSVIFRHLTTVSSTSVATSSTTQPVTATSTTTTTTQQPITEIETTVIHTTETLTSTPTPDFTDGIIVEGSGFEASSVALGLVDDEDAEDVGSGQDTKNDESAGSTSSLIHSPTVNNLVLPSENELDTDFVRECIVSSWSEWSACSLTCGFGTKMRSREIISWTGNIACPELKMEQLCGSMKQCNWNHFSFTFNSTDSVLPKKRRRPKKINMNPTLLAKMRQRQRERVRS